MTPEIFLKVFLISLVYIAAVGLSGRVVRTVLSQIKDDLEKEDGKVVGLATANMIIGKCENLIIVSCVLADQITGVALIFAAKSLVRNNKDDHRKDDIYLCGTLVNLVWSAAMGFLAKFIWQLEIPS